MDKKKLRGRLKRSSIFALIAVTALLLLFALNLLLTYLGVQKTLFIDTTPEGLYTLTDGFKEECAFIDEELGEDGKKVRITFCADPDTLLKSTVTKMVYFTAIEMRNHFDNVEVETVNITYNPTAVSKYRPTSLSKINPTDIIVSYGDRYTVVNASSFWMTAEGALYAYNGEYKMASLVMSVTAKNRPVAYFATGHGETYYDTEAPESEGSVNTASFYDLLTERGLEVKTIDLTAAKEIPDDCVLLIINDPKKDFSTDDTDKLNQFGYVSSLDVIDKYLVKDYGSVMVAKDYATSLPALESFLYEWGFDFSTSRVEDETSVVDNTGENTTIPGVYNTDENSYGFMIYSEFASLASAPVTVFSNTGYVSCSYGDGTSIPEDGSYSVERKYEPLFFSSSEAKAYENAGGIYNALEHEGSVHLAAVSTRVEMDSYTIEYKYSDVFCAPSGDFFSNELLGNSSFANYQIVSVLTENLIRTEEYASTDLGNDSINFDNVGGKPLQSTAISETVETDIDEETKETFVVHYGLDDGTKTALAILLALFPLCAIVTGIVVCIRRRYL